MKYSEYEIAFSPARLKKYLDTCGGDRVKALSLYRHNIKLCQKFYGILNVFEVVLRNSINLHYCKNFSDPNWIRNQRKVGGILERAQRTEFERTVEMLLRQDKYSNDRLVSSVSFGFWTYLFNRIPYRNSGMNLLKIYPNKTSSGISETFIMSYRILNLSEIGLLIMILFVLILRAILTCNMLKRDLI